MMYCNKCKVNVAGNKKVCPLCQNELKKENISELDQEVFPLIPTVYKKFKLFFKIFIFASICACVICVALNIIFFKTVWWSVFVVLGIICVWISLFIAVQKRRNIPKNLVYQVFFASVISIIWDAVTGWKGWSLDFAIPCVCIAAMIAMAVLSFVLNIHIQDFIIYFIVNIIFGIIPTLFLLLNIVHIRYPSIICIAGSIITLAALIVFEGANMISELKKRFHM